MKVNLMILNAIQGIASEINSVLGKKSSQEVSPVDSLPSNFLHKTLIKEFLF